MKTKTRVGLNARPDAFPGPVASLSHTAGVPSGITWPHRDGSLEGLTSLRRDSGLSQPRRCQTALRGRPVVEPTTTDGRPTSERRPRNLSVPPGRLLNTMARPPGGDRTPGNTRGNRDPRRAVAP